MVYGGATRVCEKVTVLAIVRRLAQLALRRVRRRGNSQQREVRRT